MQNAKSKLKNAHCPQFAICNWQFAIGNHGFRPRTGGVYIAVLGTALIASVLGLSTLLVQRIQNRQLSSSEDIRQAQLNAEAAVQLALLTMKQETNWRTNRTSGRWFTDRDTGAGRCTLDVVDPEDDDLADDDSEPVVITGIGTSGLAEQRIELTIEPQRQPLDCLHSAITVGDDIDLQNVTLRTDGLITADDVSASSSLVFGDVQAVGVSGSTYSGATVEVSADQLPSLPDWNTVFDYYLAAGTPINISSLPTTTPNLGRNPGIESTVTPPNDPNWTGSPPGIPSAQINQVNTYHHSGQYCLRVQSRSDWYSGAAQRIDDFVKPGGQYYIEAWVYLSTGGGRTFHIALYTKGTSDGGAQWNSGSPTMVFLGFANVGWTKVSATLTAPTWSGDLEYAFVKIGGSESSNTGDFYVDDLDIREAVSGRFIYRQVLSPSINPYGGSTNPEGIYWIDCSGNDLIIERSRILGTLLVLNPGSGSKIGEGPICWSPAVPGYPALLVDADNASDADFSIRATSRVLSEDENGVNFNPAGAPYEFYNSLISPTDSTPNDIYPTEIRGLVAVRDDLTFHNAPLIRGQLIVGDDIDNSSSGSLEVAYEPDSLLNPPPGFRAPDRYDQRPGSATKTVLP